MDTKTFLETMSVQRHDFLNHLQVISGLVQLNRGDRVRDYIKQVCAEMEKMSRVSRIAVPEVAAALLIGHFKAEKIQVRVHYEIDTCMGSSTVPGSLLGEITEEALNRSLECIGLYGGEAPFLGVYISETDGNYTLRLNFPGPPPEKTREVQVRMSEAGGGITSCGGQVGFTVSGGGGEIFISVPAGA